MDENFELDLSGYVVPEHDQAIIRKETEEAEAVAAAEAAPRVESSPDAVETYVGRVMEALLDQGALPEVCAGHLVQQPAQYTPCVLDCLSVVMYMTTTRSILHCDPLMQARGWCACVHSPARNLLPPPVALSPTLCPLPCARCRCCAPGRSR